MPPKSQRKLETGKETNIQDIINSPVVTTRSKSQEHGLNTSFTSPGDIGSPKPPAGPRSKTQANSHAPPRIQDNAGNTPAKLSDSASKSQALPVTESKSQLNFEFDPTKLSINPLITTENRGDAGAMSDALNQMYITMLTGQYKFEAYMAYNENRFHDLSDKVNTCTEKVNTCTEKVYKLS